MGIDTDLYAIDLKILGKALQDPRLFNYAVTDEDQLRDFQEQDDEAGAIRPPPAWVREGHSEEEDHLSLYRGWYIVEAVLTGTDAGGPPPLGNIVWGGHGLECCSGELGYLTGLEVRQLADALAPITDEELATRFDKQYPDGGRDFTSPVDRADRLNDAHGGLHGLREFYGRAASRNKGIVKRFG